MPATAARAADGRSARARFCCRTAVRAYRDPAAAADGPTVVAASLLSASRVLDALARAQTSNRLRCVAFTVLNNLPRHGSPEVRRQLAQPYVDVWQAAPFLHSLVLHNRLYGATTVTAAGLVVARLFLEPADGLGRQASAPQPGLLPIVKRVEQELAAAAATWPWTPAPPGCRPRCFVWSS